MTWYQGWRFSLNSLNRILAKTALGRPSKDGGQGWGPAKMWAQRTGRKGAKDSRTVGFQTPHGPPLPFLFLTFYKTTSSPSGVPPVQISLCCNFLRQGLSACVKHAVCQVHHHTPASLCSVYTRRACTSAEWMKEGAGVPEGHRSFGRRGEHSTFLQTDTSS